VSKEGDFMILRYFVVVFSAAVVATIAALSASAIEPRNAEAADTVRTCGGKAIKLNAREERTFRLHNRARAHRGIRRLCVSRKLTEAARDHSARMIRKDYFGHGNIGRRLERYDYNWRTCGENIGGGSGRYARPSNVFKRWMDSRNHRSNILKKGFREIGIGTYTGTFKGRRGYTMYTVDFGTRR
jgi:uncharacterized protein YkwD